MIVVPSSHARTGRKRVSDVRLQLLVLCVFARARAGVWDSRFWVGVTSGAGLY